MFVLDVTINVPPITTYTNNPISTVNPNPTTTTPGDTYTSSGNSGLQALEAAEANLRVLTTQATQQLQQPQSQPGQGPLQAQTPLPPASSTTQLFERFTPMITALQLTRHSDGYYTRTGGPATERYFLQTDGTIFVEGRPVPGSTSNETYGPGTITGISNGQPVFAEGPNATTPLPTTRILASLGLLRHDQPNILQPNWTFVNGDNTYRIQLDGTIFQTPTASPNGNGTVHSLATNGTVTATADQAPLPLTTGIASLGLSPNRNGDGSFSHPGHAGRYLIQADGSIFYEGRTEPGNSTNSGGVVAPYTYVFNSTTNTWNRDYTRSTRLPTTNAIATHHLILLPPTTAGQPFRFTRAGITTNGSITTTINGTAVPHDGLFELLANGDVIFHGGVVNGQVRGRLRFPANGGAPVADPPNGQPQPLQQGGLPQTIQPLQPLTGDLASIEQQLLVQQQLATQQLTQQLQQPQPPQGQPQPVIIQQPGGQPQIQTQQGQGLNFS